ncbi:hypothetical protein DR79_214 [Francisella tularensis]|uniref:Uncharacterized protein n=1 Tax=Francisella tularensis TaxID=263 RepID=A0AAW3D7E5_FRATU|nr:hypothetical protein BZ14_208 [Francisella tularensis subsp. tularensis SCHU S4]AJI70746.1 hypothetical protein CH69_436 [Francisella tularensis subsp. tularensis]KFJ38109.1 hypothetical protein DR85_184 [Francisella tularensis]KFJ41372.1 hypothetical protein DR87_996 [Francisella tularensis]KFJ44904.1 hypothetical protein DR79_214 [Francisella tularensis]
MATQKLSKFIEGIFNLSGINRRELLAAKMPDGTPGLHIALQQYHSEAVKTYREMISKLKILSNGLPGFLL